MNAYLMSMVWTAVAFGAILGLMRWAFGKGSRGRSLVARPVRPGRPDEYGVLVPVAEPRDPDRAREIRRLLAAARIRCTTVRTTDGARVMVWPQDADRARELLADGPRGPGG